jgi:hypothetical protein
MVTSEFSHGAAEMFMLSGHARIGRPTFGAWVSYGLGTLNDNLPSYVVLTNGKPFSGTSSWGSGFLPSRHQGVEFRNGGSPIQYLADPAGITRQDREDVLATVNAINRHSLSTIGDPEIATRIAQYEMAFAMQASVPELMDTKGESPQTLELYGCQPGDGSFASNCLLARRLAERGVRFIQLYHKDWDHHGGVKDGIKFKAEEIDRACMALITDLKNRGMLDSTIVVWAGEFGRTPMSQGNGRDHHNKAMSVWLAGGGIKGGVVYGASDELGYAAVENVCTVHDLHATMLHQLGIQHDAFSVKFQGLDAKLTGVEGANVLKDILA